MDSLITTMPTPLKYNGESFGNISWKGRIDYIFATEDLAKLCVNAIIVTDIETNYLSDHYPIIAEFKFNQ